MVWFAQMPRCFLAAKLKYPYVQWKEEQGADRREQEDTMAQMEGEQSMSILEMERKTLKVHFDMIEEEKENGSEKIGKLKTDINGNSSSEECIIKANRQNTEEEEKSKEYYQTKVTFGFNKEHQKRLQEEDCRQIEEKSPIPSSRTNFEENTEKNEEDGMVEKGVINDDEQMDDNENDEEKGGIQWHEKLLETPVKLDFSI